MASVLEDCRQAYDQKAWSTAYDLLISADREQALGPDDLERLAQCAYLTGRFDESDDLLARAYHDHEAGGRAQGAARCAFWLAFELLNRGEMARGGGWLARAHRLVEQGGQDWVERGYVLMPVGIQALATDDVQVARETFETVAEIAGRFDDADLMSMARLGSGQTLLRLGDTPKGIALLDEVMVAVTADELSPIVAGVVYCAVIEACQEVFDLHRAQEWTASLHRWCAAQPGLVLFRGQCLVHRAELMTIHGAWTEAWEEAVRARDRLSAPSEQPAVGAAYYQLGELYRLRGDLVEAEEAYRRADEWGRVPQPGLARLQLTRGQIATARGALRHLLAQTTDGARRARLLPVSVDLELAGGDVPGARAAATALAALAEEIGAPLLRAQADQADGAVQLAEGAPHAAVATLRRAWTRWCAIEAPYDAARTRVLIGLAARALGDEGVAVTEFDAAAAVFARLGAAPDLNWIEQLRGAPAVHLPGGLTEREVEVLRLVATGRTNRAVAAELVISEKTVARHLANIFGKLGVATRAAATAYAYEHDLV